MVKHAIPSLVAKTMEQYVMTTLDSCVTTTTSFDLWMSRFGHDTLALVINFIHSQWVPYHVTMGLFETTNMSGVAMIVQVKELLSSYNLLYKLIAYVKDEGGNLSTLAQALTFMVSCGPFALVVFWQGSSFGHAFNKTCQYAYNDINVCAGFRKVSLKAIQFAL
jgi:hypothetical protein